MSVQIKRVLRCSLSRVRTAHLLRAVGLAALSLLPLIAASAQESGRHWRLPNDEKQYRTQQEAVDAISNFGSPYEQVRHLKSQEISETEARYTYWMGVAPSELQAWKYQFSYFPQTYPSEEAQLEAMRSYYDRKSAEDGCTVGTVIKKTRDWSSLHQWSDGTSRVDLADFEVKYRADTLSGTQCANITERNLEMRQRTRCASPHHGWDEATATCRNNFYQVTVVSTPLACDQCGLVGNPIDVVTGNKVQREVDFDLGWVAFERTYHSGTTNAHANLGVGWTHSHALSLAIGVDSDGSGPPVALVQSNGAHRPFRRMSSNSYEAADGSGDRLERGARWILFSGNSTTTFTPQGRLESVDRRDGTLLSYTYDQLGRLEKVTHSSGRALSFSYLRVGADSRIETVALNGQTILEYGYSPTSNLETVTSTPARHVRTYHYEDARFPHHLTGISGEDRVRFSTYSYDDQGRAVTSAHSDGAASVSLVYTAEGGATVTDALSAAATHALTTDDGTGRPRKPADVTAPRGTVRRLYEELDTDFRRRLRTTIDLRDTRTEHTYEEDVDSITGFPVRIHRTVEAVGTPEERASATRTEIATNTLVASSKGNTETRVTRNDRLQITAISKRDVANGRTQSTSMTYCERVDADAGICPRIGLLLRLDGPRTDAVDTVSFTYYSADHAECEANPSGCSYRKGDLWKVTNAIGQVTETLRYDSAGRPLSVKDANGVVTDFEYHPRGWLTARKVRGMDVGTEADDAITRIAYFPTGLVERVTQPDGSFTTYAYDAAYRLTGIGDSIGNRIAYKLDNAGNRTKEDTLGDGDVLTRTLSRVYNQLGELALTKDAHGRTTGAFTYDAAGSTDTVTDARYTVADNDHDPLGRLTRTLEDVGGIQAETKFTHNALDQLTQVKDPKGLDTKYEYDGLGNLMMLASPDTGITTYTYDTAGNRLTQKDARNKTTTYTYDALNRIKTVRYAATSLNATYTYDTVQAACVAGETFAVGRLAHMRDGSGSTTYCYDRRGNVVRKVQTTNGKVFTVRYAYNLADHLMAVTYPSGTRVDYVRNDNGHTSGLSVTQPGLPEEVLLSSVSYYPFGPASELRYGDGRLLKRSLTLDYLPGFIEDTMPGGLDLGYEFDTSGHLVTLRKADQSEPPLRKYRHDNLGRIVKANDGVTDAVLHGYDYDKTGNRLAVTENGSVTGYQYGAGSHRLLSVGGNARSYDAAGNTTAALMQVGGPIAPPPPAGDPVPDPCANCFPGDPPNPPAYETAALGIRAGRDTSGVDSIATESAATSSAATTQSVTNMRLSFAYNDAGRLESTLTSTGETRARYAYNGKGEQTFIDTALSPANYVVYDEAGQVLGVYNSAGERVQEFVWLNQMPVGLMLGTTAATNKLHYIQPDHLGTPRAIIDKARQKAIWTWPLTGEAFGNTAPNQDPDADGVQLVFDLRFPGQRFDAASGLNQNYLRDGFESATGRYSQADPIGLKGGITAYGYASSKPFEFVDPLGLAVAGAIPMPASPPINWGIARGAAGRLGPVAGAAWAGWELGTLIHNQVGEQIGQGIDAIADACASINKPKCLPATTANIVGALNTSNMMTMQPSVSRAMIGMYIENIQLGVMPNPIRVDGNVIVDGNHRYVAFRLCNLPPITQDWISPPSVPRYSVRTLRIDP